MTEMVYVVTPQKGGLPPKYLSMRRDIIEYKIAKDLINLVSKKGSITLSEAHRRLHIEMVIDPTGKNPLSVIKIIERHPLEFKVDGKRIMAAR